jgi:hypothetical protein
MMDDKYDSKVNLILCSNSMKQTIAEALAVVRRTVNTTDITVGYSSLIINNIPVVSDKFCPENKIYLLNTDDFMINQLCDWEWLEDEDGKVLKQVPGKAAYSATLVKYAELVCKNPGGQCLLEVE